MKRTIWGYTSYETTYVVRHAQLLNNNKRSGENLMKCIVVCNKQLPIRYLPLQQIYFSRGMHCPKEITLPFYVNVESNHNDYRLLLQYIKEIDAQYSQCAFEIYSEDSRIIDFFQQHLPNVQVHGKVLLIHF